MLRGRLPKQPATPPVYERGDWQLRDLDPASKTLGRRGLLLISLGLVSTGATGWFLGRRSAPAIGRDEESVEESAAPLPEWAREMLRVDAQTLMSRAGDYERWSRRHLDDPRITKGFVRLLDVASRTDSDISDPACACAIRTLAKLERFDLIRDWLPSSGERPSARRTAETLIEEQLPFSSRSRKGGSRR